MASVFWSKRQEPCLGETRGVTATCHQGVSPSLFNSVVSDVVSCDLWPRPHILVAVLQGDRGLKRILTVNIAQIEELQSYRQTDIHSYTGTDR